jgi:hypothetical protein
MNTRILPFLLAMFSVAVGLPASAQEPGRWGKLTDDRGVGQGICIKGQYQTECLALRCGKGREFEIVALSGSLGKEADVRFEVDGSLAATLAMSRLDYGAVAPLEGPEADALLAALASGSSVRASILPELTFTLRGSSAAIEDAREACTRYDTALAGPRKAPFGAERLADEAAEVAPSSDFPQFELYRNADMWGFDLDEWTKDPLYESMDLDQCQRLCSTTRSCKAFTHNARFSTCILKNGIGELSGYEGATTGVMTTGAPDTLLPPTSGPGASIIPSAGWTEGDTSESYYARLRRLAKPLGRSCSEERRVLEDLAASFSMQVNGDSGIAGQPLPIDWSGNGLVERIPVWLVVSSKQRVRFDGKGFFALAPGPIAPFGIEQGRDGTRAFVALYARGAGTSGRLGIVPLDTGSLDVDLSLVGYLRECEQEIVLASSSINLPVSPAAPEIVLSSDAVASSFHTRFSVAEFERDVEFGDDRYRISMSLDDTEIVERQGRNLMLSPTRRFLAAEADGNIEIVDVVDGTVVAAVETGALRWAMNDSFVYTDQAPWGELAFASTYAPTLHIERQATGPSCCLAGDTALITINLENSVVGIHGTLGYRYTALQNTSHSIEENPHSGYAASKAHSTALLRTAFESFGLVAPVSVAAQPNFVGGLRQYYRQDEPWRSPAEGGADEQRAFLVANGVDARPIERREAGRLRVASADVMGSPIVRSASNAVDAADSLVNQLSRIGIAANAGIPASLEAIAPNPQGWAEQVYAKEGLGNIEESKAAFDKERKAAGYDFTWYDPEKEMQTEMYCENASESELSAEFDAIERVEAPAGNVWIVRVACTGGATFGSQRGASMLYVFDLSQPYSGVVGDYLVADSNWMAGTFVIADYEYNFTARLFDRTLVLFGPSTGMVAIFDLDRRSFVSRFDGLPNGDLLEQVYAIDTLTHFVALGSDDSIVIFGASDGGIVLSGKIVDDEIVVWNDRFQFDSTAEGANFVELRFPGSSGQYSFALFARALRVEGLAGKVMAGQPVPEAPAIGQPPGITGSIAADGDTLRVTAMATSRSSLAQLFVYQDGALTGTYDIDGRQAAIELSPPRLVGSRWASVVAVDDAGLVSLPLNVDLGEDRRGKARSTLLAIGVDFYEDSRIGSLNYAKSDVANFMAAFGEVGASTEDAVVLTDRRADQSTVIAEVKAFAERLQPGDHGVIFVASHGLRGADGTFYLATSQTNLDDLEGTAVRWDHIAAALAGTEGRITIFIDACHAGATGAGAFASNDDAVGAFAGLGDAKVTILAASKGRELSGESASAGGGVFTGALIQVMTRDRGTYDANSNGQLEATELYLGVKQLVVNERDGLQTPWLSANTVAGQYAIF